MDKKTNSDKYNGSNAGFIPDFNEDGASRREKKFFHHL
jgi:hypothetical protein